MHQDGSQEQNQIVVAIADSNTSQWQYFPFLTKEEARQAIKKTRS